MNFVAADLGASGTRYVSDNGKICTLPNNMVPLNVGEMTALQPNAEDIESNLELTIEKEGDSEFFPASLLVGKMAERHSATFLTPNVVQPKYKQQINYLSAIIACAVSKIKNNLDDDILLVMDVPPIEINIAKKVFKENLVGKYKVTFHKYNGGTVVNFNIVNVEVYEESVMAMASFFFNMNGAPKAEAREYMRGRVLSLDIGASTSDLAVIQDGKFLDYTGRTIKTGGNVARGAFINLIAAQEGYEMPEGDAEVAIAEGRIAEGNGYKDVGDLVAESKKELAAQIKTNLSTYFSQIKIPVNLIRAVVVSGGGSMAGQYINSEGEVVVTSQPLSTYVTDELQDICKGVVAIPYGEDARFANVKGLFIRAKMLMMKYGANRPAPQQAAKKAEAPVQGIGASVQGVGVAQPTVNVAHVNPTVQAPVSPVAPATNVTPVSIPVQSVPVGVQTPGVTLDGNMPTI